MENNFEGDILFHTILLKQLRAPLYLERLNRRGDKSARISKYVYGNGNMKCELNIEQFIFPVLGWFQKTSTPTTLNRRVQVQSFALRSNLQLTHKTLIKYTFQVCSSPTFTQNSASQVQNCCTEWPASSRKSISYKLSDRYRWASLSHETSPTQRAH